jgi:hypothetical protein
MRVAADLDRREGDIDAGTRDVDAIFGVRAMAQRCNKQRTQKDCNTARFHPCSSPRIASDLAG